MLSEKEIHQGLWVIGGIGSPEVELREGRVERSLLCFTVSFPTFALVTRGSPATANTGKGRMALRVVKGKMGKVKLNTGKVEN